MSTVEFRIAENLARIHGRIGAACRRAGRDANQVRLVAVTKSAELEWIEALIALGVGDVGESRPQQLLERAQELRGAHAPIRWHLIGHLQRNKVRKILPAVVCLHSVDSLTLAARIDSLADELGLKPRVLLEANVSGEASKDGFAPEELAADWASLCNLSHVEIAGLMTIAPFSDDPEESRPTFRRLRELRDRLADRPESPPLPELSMGMSGDFEVAIEEGATMVRIGSSLFEGLSAPVRPEGEARLD
jgi:PLP dependent protein